MSFNLRQKPNTRERIIFFAALAVFAFVFYRIGVKGPSVVSKALEEVLAKVTAEKLVLSQRSSLKTSAATKTALPKTAADKITWVGKKESFEFATDALVRASQENGLQLMKFNFPESKDKQNYLFKPISITLAGTVSDLGRYLKSTEHLPIPLVVEQLSLEPSADFASIVTLRIEGGFYAEK